MSPKISLDVLSKTVNEQEVVVELSTGNYFAMNSMGSLIWNKLKQGYGIAMIADGIANEYDVTLEQATEDLNEFLVVLKNENLIMDVIV